MNVETFRSNPERVNPGDTVILHTHTGGKLKGKVVDRSADEIVLKGGKRIPTDEIVAIEVNRFSGAKTAVAGFLILAGAALVAGIIYGIAYLFSHTA